MAGWRASRRVRRSFVVLALVVGVVPAFPAESAAADLVVNVATDGDDGSCDALESGDCTLREAIEAANGASGHQTIGFDIGGGGTATITPTSSLPEVTDPVTMDGLTQGCGDRLPTDPDPCIEVDGSNVDADGLVLAPGSGGSTLRGLAVTGFGDTASVSGVRVLTSGNTIEDGFVGVELDGSTADGNTFTGVWIEEGDANTIRNNVVSGNGFNGMFLRGGADGANDNVIEGNLIGTAANGTDPLPNVNFDGIDVDSGDGNRIEGNTIAFNGTGSNDFGVDGDGVDIGVGSDGHVSTGNTITGNSIHSNETLGIDLNGDDDLAEAEVTPNDFDDPDDGANDLQNFPVLTSALRVVGGTQVEGTLDSTPEEGFTVEIFSNGECDPSGHGEGATFLGSTTVMTDPDGDAAFTATVDEAPSDHITATATNEGGSTSELGACVPLRDLEVTKADTPDPVFPGGTLRYSVDVSIPGDRDMTGVEVVDDLPEEVGSPTIVSDGGFSCTTGGGDVRCEGALDGGQTRTIEIDVLVDADVPDGEVFTNVATASPPDPDAPDATAAEDTTASDRCDGKAATVDGTEGTPGDDVIVGTPGDDDINGGEGDDTICGRGGTDQIFGEGGNDTIFGNGATDLLFGNEGNDELFGGDGTDLLNGGAGNDPLLHGGKGDDMITGGPGNDGGLDEAGDPVPGLAGGQGFDILRGDDGDDVLLGGPEGDELHGGPGDDRIFGNEGNDELFGDNGTDLLSGGAGNDPLLHGGKGDDTIRGGPGNDRGRETGLTGGQGFDTLHGDDGNDVLKGGPEGDELHGGRGFEFLLGGGGNDELFGESGDDFLLGGKGNDPGHGGAGDDVCRSIEDPTSCER